MLNSNFNFNATVSADYYIHYATKMVKFFKMNNNTPLTCKEIAELVDKTHQQIAQIAYHCNLFKVKKEKVGERLCAIRTICHNDYTITHLKNGKFKIVEHDYASITDIEKIEENGEFITLYKTFPEYKTYISLSKMGLDLV